MNRFCLVAVLLCSGWSAVAAKTVDVPGEAASVDIPDAWTSQTQPPPANSGSTQSVLILSALSAEKTSLLQIEVCANPRGIMAGQPDLVGNIKDAITNQIVSHGGAVQFTSEGKVALNDVPAYLIQYTTTSSPSAKQVLGRSYEVAANGKLYLISLRTFDAASDGDLQGIANSLRFASPPVLPSPPVSHRWLKIALAAGGGVVLLVLAGVGIYYYRQRQLYE